MNVFSISSLWQESLFDLLKPVLWYWTTSTSKGIVTYETSYLPFLFPSSSDQEDGDDEEEDEEEPGSIPPAYGRRSKIQGRRVFGKKGKEIVYQDQTGSDHEGEGVRCYHYHSFVLSYHHLNRNHRNLMPPPTNPRNLVSTQTLNPSTLQMPVDSSPVFKNLV